MTGGPHPLSAEAGPMAGGVGERLRALRQERGWSLTELAAASGVPVSTISKIENGHLNPSLVHAINLASALEANLGFLVERDGRAPARFSVVRTRQRARLDLPGMALALQDLHGDFAPGVLEARLGILAPGAQSGDETMTHPGEEICHVLDGAIGYEIDGERFDLGAGDTIHFRSTAPHRWRNTGQDTTRVLWVFSEGLSF